MQHVIEVDGNARRHGRTVDERHHAAVGSQSEYRRAVADDHHGLIGLHRVHHDVEGEALARQVHLVGRTHREFVEGQAGRGRQAVRLRLSQHLKVVDAAQIVAGNVLREGYLDVVADAQDAVHRLRCTEGTWRTGILDTCQYLRRACQESTGVAAVVHGTDVVVLLYRVYLAIEWCHDDTVRRYRVGHTAGFRPQLLVSIV